MKVTCKQNTLKDFDLSEVIGFFNKNAKYHVDIGQEYLVMGIMIPKYNNCLYYMVDNGDLPIWNPYFLFDISDNSLPNDWYVKVYNKNDPDRLFYLSGFYELCNDEDFHDLLLDCDKNARAIYFQRKTEFENDHNAI